MKRLCAAVIVFAMVLSFMPVFAETTSETVDVSIEGIYEDTNHWENATYTYNVVDGTAENYGWISNGDYKFMYYPSEGKIKNAAQDTSFGLEAGKTIPELIVIPTQIGAFSAAGVNYPEKSIVLSASNPNYAIFRYDPNANTTIVIPEGVTTIPASVFGQNYKSNTNQEFILPSTLTTIKSKAFAQSSGGGVYKDLVIPPSVTTIEGDAFQNCRNKNYVLPAGVTTLNAIFTFNRNLENVTFKGAIPNIPNNCFRECYSIKTITFEGNSTAPTVGSLAFNKVTDGSNLTIYYPANATGFTDPDFQALFPQGTTFTKLAGEPCVDDITISGQNIVGRTLTGSYTYSDPSDREESGSTYTWRRADDADFTINVTDIASGSCTSGTDVTYTLTSQDLGKYIQFAVVPRNADDELNIGTEATYVLPDAIRTINTVPQVTLTSPSQGFRAYVNSDITMSATATCDEVSISKIEYYANDVKVAESTEAPFDATWTPTVDGEYEVYAMAYNTLDESGVSAAAEIKIYSLSESIEPVWASKWSYDFNQFNSTEPVTAFPGENPPWADMYAGEITSEHGLFGKAQDDYCMALRSIDGASESARIYLDKSKLDAPVTNLVAEMDVAFSTTDETRYLFCYRTSKPYNGMSFGTGGSIGYYDPTGWHSFVDENGQALKYVANTWYHIGVKFDFVERTITYYLEGQNLGTFNAQDELGFTYTSEISTKGIHNSGKQYGIVYMDNFSVSQEQDSYVTSKITSVQDGTFVLKGNNITLEGYAKDSRGNEISKVEIYSNGQLLTESTDANYEITTSLPCGKYAIQARAISSDGLVGYSEVYNVTVDSISTPTMVSNGMVLQRNKPIKLSGFGVNGSEATVSIAGETATATVVNGEWTVNLPALPTTKSTTLTITSSDGIVTEYTNVAIGEVILCAGQSNMAYALNKFSSLMGTADMDYDDIRLYTQSSATSGSAKSDIPDGEWSIATQSNALNFSGVGFASGKLLYDALDGEVPVGLIYAAYSGSNINMWVPYEAYSNDPDLLAMRTGSTYYNKMVAPWTGFTIGHVVWYQGEANTHFSNNYEKALTGLIDGYRQAFGDESMDFSIIQLPIYDYQGHYSGVRLGHGVREGEWNVSERLDNVATIVTMDTGEYNNIHPNDKMPVVERVALALSHFSGDDNVIWRSPSYKMSVQDGNTMKIYFKDIADGLSTKDGQAPRGFKVAGDDGVYVDAVATLVDNCIIVDTSAVVGEPKVRYAFEDGPALINGSRSGLNLVNSAGLPMAPFRTDYDNYQYKTYADGVYSNLVNYTPMIRSINAELLSPDLARIIVNARDYDDYIGKLEVYADNTKIGEATQLGDSAEWVFDWNGATSGTHEFYAIATDTYNTRSTTQDSSLGNRTVTPKKYSISLGTPTGAQPDAVSNIGWFTDVNGSFVCSFDGQDSVSVNADLSGDEKLIFAAYDADNTLVGIKVAEGNNASFTAEELENAVVIKAFLFDNQDNIAPVVNAKTLRK